MFRHGKPPRIRGWASVRTRGHVRSQSRYLRLVTHTLTLHDAPEDDAPPLTTLSLTGAAVGSAKRRKEVTLAFQSGERLVLRIRKEDQFAQWLAATRCAARVVADYYRIVPGKVLGIGAFSRVYFGFDLESGDHVAIKVVDKTCCCRAELEHASCEARVLSFATHDHVVRCFDIFDTKDALHVVMAHMAGGTLEQKLKALGGATPCVDATLTTPAAAAVPAPDVPLLPDAAVAAVMRNVLSALAHMHDNGIVHRDLKPDNVLVSGDTDPLLWASSAVVSDFGLAAYISADDQLTEVVGTSNYLAPEVLRRDDQNSRVGYGPQVDVWAAGILFYWMLAGGALPFDADDPVAIFRAIRSVPDDTRHLDLSAPVWARHPPDAIALLHALLNPVPTRRLSAVGALTHPYLRPPTAPEQPPQQQPFLPASHSAVSVADPSFTAAVRFRAAAMAVIAISRLADKLRLKGRTRTVTFGLPASMRAGRNARPRILPMEQAPAGVDGIGYNLGLLPLPRRKAVPAKPTDTQAGATQSAASSSSLLKSADAASVKQLSLSLNSSLASGSSVISGRLSRGSNASGDSRSGVGKHNRRILLSPP
jgi:calcium/calmodulin-dependent protein kinase I